MGGIYFGAAGGQIKLEGDGARVGVRSFSACSHTAMTGGMLHILRVKTGWLEAALAFILNELPRFHG